MDIAQKTLALPGIDIAYLDGGQGLPLVFLHGWPEWSGVWRRNLPDLARDFRVIAPDLRGFGRTQSAEPARAVEDYVEDLLAFVEALGLLRFGLIGHDVGGFLMLEAARRQPERLAGLFFFDCPHFGIGKRWLEGGQVREIWYQTFHQMPFAADLVGASRATCRAYFAYFLQHWSHDPAAFEAVLEEWVDNFLQPGRLSGGFDWYKSVNAKRLAAMANPPPPPAPIGVPAFSLWGESDAILRVEWQETLRPLFTDITLERAPQAGHFVHWEQPALANARIKTFFAGRE